jgi:hypothetical protein
LPTTQELKKYLRRKKRTSKHSRSNAIVLHEGASAWGISGKGDIDIYIPVPVN